MNKTEQCRELLKQLVDDRDNEKWLPVTLSFLANLADKKAIYNGERVVIVGEGGVAV